MKENIFRAYAIANKHGIQLRFRDNLLTIPADREKILNESTRKHLRKHGGARRLRAIILTQSQMMECQDIGIYSLVEQAESANKILENRRDLIILTEGEIRKAPEELRAITIHAHHALAIALGIKDEEYRSRYTHYRGWILIHASAQKLPDTHFAHYGLEPSLCDGFYGAIIGAAKLADIEGDEGDYTYRLTDAFLFDGQIKCAGNQAIIWGASNSEKNQAFDIAWSLIG